MEIELKILNKKFYKPEYATSGSAAVDLVSTEDVTVYPGEVKKIHTGIAVHIASGKHATSFYDYAGLILPRSGLGTKGLILANTVGLIDGDYQGELLVSAWNRNETLESIIKVKAGDRFAQLMFIPILQPTFRVVSEFSDVTNRGLGGFGSTDKQGDQN